MKSVRYKIIDTPRLYVVAYFNTYIHVTIQNRIIFTNKFMEKFSIFQRTRNEIADEIIEGMYQ